MSDPEPITTEYTENIRYDYPMTPDSLVLDCGGYEGNFARLINEKYGCRVVIFEPVKAFFKQCRTMFDTEHPMNIEVRHEGVGAWERDTEFHIHGDGTGLHTDTVFPKEKLEREKVHIIRLSEWIGEKRIDLLKLNIEGMEFETIADLITTGRIRQVVNLQVQFHRIRNSDEQLHSIMRNELLHTHRLTHDFPFCWELFTLRNEC